MVNLLGPTAILLLTITLVIVRPRQLPEWWAAVGGAALMLLGRYASVGDLLRVTRQVADLLLFLIGMMVLTAVVQRAGVFDLLARWTARAARGSGLGLFVGVFLLGFAITAVLSLDVTVLVLTPIVYALTAHLRVKALPFLYACTFVANIGSLLLPISNLTNLLGYGLLGLSFTTFLRLMWWPQIAALLTSLALFLLLFRHDLPRRFVLEPQAARPAAGSPAFLRSAGAVLGMVLVALLIAGWQRWPLALPALLGGLVLLLLAWWRFAVAPRAVLGEVAWGLVPLIIGMFTVIDGAARAWLGQFGAQLTVQQVDLPTLLLVAFGTGLGANLVNNIPMFGAMISVLGQSAPSVREPLALAAILGANIGPIVTPFGSLATLLWLTIIRQQGEWLPTHRYMRVSVLIAPPTLLAATLALWLALR